MRGIGEKEKGEFEFLFLGSLGLNENSRVVVRCCRSRGEGYGGEAVVGWGRGRVFM